MSSPREQARQRFAHALLERAYAGAEADAAQEERVRRALAAAQAAPQDAPLPVRHRRWARRSGWAGALAAAALVAWVLIGPAAPTTSAAVVARVLEAHRQPVDRQYSMVREGGLLKRSVEGMLYVRGGERFALRLDDVTPGGRGGELWAGFDGDEAWLVPPRRILPVLVNPGRSRVSDWLAERGTDVPFLELDSVLTSLGEDYALEELGTDPFGDPLSDRFVCVAGSRTEPKVGAPERIELRADAATGEVERLRLTWNRTGRRVVTFAHVAAQPVDDEWYGHAAHHGPLRRVVKSED